MSTDTYITRSLAFDAWVKSRPEHAGPPSAAEAWHQAVMWQATHAQDQRLREALGAPAGKLMQDDLVERARNAWEDTMRWRWMVRHASLGFHGAPHWTAVIRLPVFDHADQTITSLVDSARKAVEEMTHERQRTANEA